ncbi:DUF4352 domain-containing protein [Streptomyces sp. NPDC018584]|uniref:DUF4352 domain-containing protein n=1 Tax=unclassified Streptomyces TaxID=2593676 RepID=UPI0037972BFF
MRIRATSIAATVLVVGALTVTTACGSTDKDVNTKPKAAASADGAKSDDTSSEGKPAAKAKAKAKADQDAGIGDTVAVTGLEEGSGLDVTLVKVADNAKSGDEYSVPEKGKRWLGLQFRLVNTGTKAYADSPQNGIQVTDADGQQFQTTFADITAGPSLSSGVRLKPGAKALGWVVVEVPKEVTATTAQFTMDSGMADQSGEWKLK